MKLAAVSLIFLAALGSSYAGSFGGPAPFQNGSPLITGTDGVYSGIASAKNLTGIINFAISEGVQSSSTSSRVNGWSFFVDGEVVSGITTATVSNKKVAGVLDQGATTSSDTGSDTLEVPAVIYIPATSTAYGSFNASMDMSSPVASWNGSGKINGAPARVDQLIIIDEFGFSTTVSIPINASGISERSFKISGTRVTQ